MGQHLVNRGVTNTLATACAIVIVLLNVVLIYATFGGSIPGAGAS